MVFKNFQKVWGVGNGMVGVMGSWPQSCCIHLLYMCNFCIDLCWRKDSTTKNLETLVYTSVSFYLLLFLQSQCNETRSLPLEMPLTAFLSTNHHKNLTEREKWYIFWDLLAQTYSFYPDLLRHCVSLLYFSWAMAYFYECIHLTTSNLSSHYWSFQFVSNFSGIENGQSPISVVYKNHFHLSISCCMSPQIALAYLCLIKATNAFSACFLITLLSSVGSFFAYMFLLTLPWNPDFSATLICVFFNACIFSIFMPVFLDFLPLRRLGTLTALLPVADWVYLVPNQ